MAFSSQNTLPTCVQPIGATPTGDDTFYPLRLPLYLLLEWMYKWSDWQGQITAAPLVGSDSYGFNMDANGLQFPQIEGPPLQKRACPFSVELGAVAVSYVYDVAGICAFPPGPNDSTFLGGAQPSFGGTYTTGAPEWIEQITVAANVLMNFSSILYDPATQEYLPRIEVNIRQELEVTDFFNIPPNPPDQPDTICLPPSEVTYLVNETFTGGGSDLIGVTIDGLSFGISSPVGPSGASGGFTAFTITPITAFP